MENNLKLFVDDLGVLWKWDGCNMVAHGDLTDDGGYPALSVDEVIETLIDGLYTEQPVVPVQPDIWAAKPVADHAEKYRFRGAAFTWLAGCDNAFYLLPPAGLSTWDEVSRYSPTEQEMSLALGFPVIVTDHVGLVSIYARE